MPSCPLWIALTVLSVAMTISTIPSLVAALKSGKPYVYGTCPLVPCSVMWKSNWIWGGQTLRVYAVATICAGSRGRGAGLVGSCGKGEGWVQARWWLGGCRFTSGIVTTHLFAFSPVGGSLASCISRTFKVNIFCVCFFGSHSHNKQKIENGAGKLIYGRSPPPLLMKKTKHITHTQSLNTQRKRLYLN